ncbi:MAG: NUDIX hydrolase [Peptostreptococcaceae bacterium]|nr:NUDIX hydrolase [Peptostreptococcaceae bacterium]
MTFKEITISSEYIYKGKMINLRKDNVEIVNGKTSIREIVEHNGGVGLAVLTEHGKMVLVRQFRKPLERDILEIPAGKIEKNEEPMVAAIRELKEETGYTAKNMKFIGKMYPSVGYTTELIYLYLCTELTPGETDFDESEAIDIEEYDLEELYKMSLSGKIEDGKTLAAILLVYGRKNE